MYKYSVYGIGIESQIELPSASEISQDTENKIQIIENEIEEYNEIQEYIINSPKEDEAGNPLWYTGKIRKDVSLFDIKNVGFFKVEYGNKIFYKKTCNIEKYNLEQWILNMCVPIAMMQNDEIILHGSGLLTDSHTMLISGRSGSGKSTLANALIDLGLGFVSDDSVKVEIKDGSPYATGSYPLRKLCSDTVDWYAKNPENMIEINDGGRQKFALKMKEDTQKKNKFKSLVILEASDCESVNIREVKGTQKINYLIECLYKKDSYYEMGFSSRILKTCLLIAAGLEMYVIERPKNKMTVMEQIQCLKNKGLVFGEISL